MDLTDKEKQLIERLRKNKAAQEQKKQEQAKLKGMNKVGTLKHDLYMGLYGELIPEDQRDELVKEFMDEHCLTSSAGEQWIYKSTHNYWYNAADTQYFYGISQSLAAQYLDNIIYVKKEAKKNK